MLWGYTIGQIAIAVIVIAAIVGIVYVALRQSGVVIPEWVKQVMWIVVAAFVCVFAVKVLLTLL